MMRSELLQRGESRVNCSRLVIGSEAIRGSVNKEYRFGTGSGGFDTGGNVNKRASAVRGMLQYVNKSVIVLKTGLLSKCGWRASARAA